MTTSATILRNTTFKFTAFVILTVTFFCAGRYIHISRETYQSFLAGFPLALSGIIFVVLYVVVTTLIWLGPKDLFRITAALVYGAYVSTFLVWLAEMINAVVLFHLSRKLGRGFVEAKMRGRMARLDRAMAETGFWWIFWMRLFLVPFRFLDLGAGLTTIPFGRYFVIAAAASPLRIFIIQYMLTLGADVIRDPYKLAARLLEVPFILWLNFSYVIGAVIFLLIFRRRSRRRQSAPR